MRKLFVLILALSLGACASTTGSKIDPATTAKFAKGKTTYAQVLATLGEPVEDVADGNGTRYVIYSYSATETNGAEYIPLVGGFLAKGKRSVETTTFLFDKKLLLVSQHTDYGTTH